MIYLHKLDKHNWLVQHNDQIKRVNTKAYNLIHIRKKHNVKRMRYAITKATKIPAKELRFIGNVRLYERWVTQWVQI